MSIPRRTHPSNYGRELVPLSLYLDRLAACRTIRLETPLGSTITIFQRVSAPGRTRLLSLVVISMHSSTLICLSPELRTSYPISGWLVGRICHVRLISRTCSTAQLSQQPSLRYILCGHQEGFLSKLCQHMFFRLISTIIISAPANATLSLLVYYTHTLRSSPPNWTLSSLDKPTCFRLPWTGPLGET